MRPSPSSPSQVLTDTGFRIPAMGGHVLGGEAMQKLNHNQVGPRPDTTGLTTKTFAAIAAHLALLLRDRPYPPS